MPYSGNPDYFLDELLYLLKTNRFISVYYTTIYYKLKWHGVSLKKLKQVAKECSEKLRADFIRRMAQYGSEEISFIDETLRMREPFVGIMGDQGKGLR